VKRRRPVGAPGLRALRGIGIRAAWLMLILPGFAGADTPPRIASLNLCTDVLLLEAAPPSTRLLLTALAADPNLSPYAARAARQARHRGLAEEILTFEPEWVLAETGQAEAVRARLTRAGLEVVVLPPATDMATYEKNLARVRVRLGLPPSPSAADLTGAQAQGVPLDAAPETALVLAGNAYAPGPESLADDLLAAAGLQDARAAFGVKAGGEIPLESLVLNPPQFIVRSAAANGSQSLAEALLTHRALRRRLGEDALVPLPESLWICGSQRTREGIALITHARLRNAGGNAR